MRINCRLSGLSMPIFRMKLSQILNDVSRTSLFGRGSGKLGQTGCDALDNRFEDVAQNSFWVWNGNPVLIPRTAPFNPDSAALCSILVLTESSKFLWIDLFWSCRWLEVYSLTELVRYRELIEEFKLISYFSSVKIFSNKLTENFDVSIVFTFFLKILVVELKLETSNDFGILSIKWKKNSFLRLSLHRFLGPETSRWWFINW